MKKISVLILGCLLIHLLIGQDPPVSRTLSYPSLLDYEFGEIQEDTSTSLGHHFVDSFIIDQFYDKQGREVKNPFTDIQSFNEVGKIEYYKATKWKVYSEKAVRFTFEQLDKVATFQRVSEDQWQDDAGQIYRELKDQVVLIDSQLVIDPENLDEWFDCFIKYAVEKVE